MIGIPPIMVGDGELLMAIDMRYDEGGSGDTPIVSYQISITEQAKKTQAAMEVATGKP